MSSVTVLKLRFAQISDDIKSMSLRLLSNREAQEADRYARIELLQNALNVDLATAALLVKAHMLYLF